MALYSLFLVVFVDAISLAANVQIETWMSAIARSCKYTIGITLFADE